MNISDIPVRVNGRKVEASWWNDIRTALLTALGGATAETQQTISNNAAATAITGLLLDSTTLVYARVLVSVYRQTDAPTKLRQVFTLDCYFKTGTGWDFEPQSVGEDSGLTFTIDATTGQISYASSNVAGANYVGKARWKIDSTMAVET